MVIASCEEVAGALRAEVPSLPVYVPPEFDPADPSAFSDVVRATSDVLDRADPEFVFVGISYPKQQQLAFALIDWLRRRAGACRCSCSSEARSTCTSGGTPRAPAWMQRVGAEWFFRFLLEPRRLFRRYFVEDVRFQIVGRQPARRRERRRRRPTAVAEAVADVHDAALIGR